MQGRTFCPQAFAPVLSAVASPLCSCDAARAQAASTTQSPDSTFDLEAFFGSTSHGWLGQGMCDFLVDGDDGDDPLVSPAPLNG